MLTTLITDNHACIKSVILYISILLCTKLLEANAIAVKVQQTIKTVALHINASLLSRYFLPLMLNGVIPQENEQKKTGRSTSYNIFIATETEILFVIIRENVKTRFMYKER